MQNQFDIMDQGALKDLILSHKIEFNELTIEVDGAKIADVILALRDAPEFEYTTLVDITAIDYPGLAKRFHVIYHLLSMTKNQRVRIALAIEEDGILPSITAIHPSANWFEREVFDMFGIPFSGHPDLRRILTDYGFQGFPLRKDFPTSGYVQMRYDDVAKKCIYEPVELVQDYRQFDFLSPWESAKYILPGDEKKA